VDEKVFIFCRTECLQPGKLEAANEELVSLRLQLSIMEDRTRNLNILADDVNGVSAEEARGSFELLFKSFRIIRIVSNYSNYSNYFELFEL
jgi:hypothetical protein